MSTTKVPPGGVAADLLWSIGEANQKGTERSNRFHKEMEVNDTRQTRLGLLSRLSRLRKRSR